MINLLNEKHITNAHVYIEGEKTEFVSLELHQSFGEHHTFTIILDYDRINKSFLSNPLEQMGLIGKVLDIDLLQGADNSNVYEFRGIICDVSHEAREGKHGFLIIEGKSPTILLERGKRLDVFSGMNLMQVFDEVTSGTTNKSFSCVNKPAYSGIIDFLMQYQESDWEFLQRLSAITGETLFYTGRDLVFGQYDEWKPTEVTYDEEITGFKFGSRLLTNDFLRYQYLPEQHNTIEQEAPSSVENSNEYISSSTARSRETLGGRPVKTPLSVKVEDKGSLNELVSREKSTNAVQAIYIKGSAKTCAARLGRQVSIKMPVDMPQAKHLGTYLVTKVKHIIDQNHRYSGEFEAIPASLKHIPATDIKIPVADSICATVIKNDDPKGQGRIKVEFPFAQDRVSETWLRVMTPDAGSSDNVQKNRGIVFIPEIGDQVMIGFEFGDPNRPYVMGSMFHGQNGSGGGSNNTTKSIFTRSGIQIVFNDDEKSLHIEDPSGNTWDMDGKGNINITAPNDITVNGKNMTLNIEQDLTCNVSNNATYNVANNMNLNVTEGLVENVKTRTVEANNINTHTKEDYGINVDGTFSSEVKKAKHSASGNYKIDSGKKVIISGSDEVKLT